MTPFAKDVHLLIQETLLYVSDRFADQLAQPQPIASKNKGPTPQILPPPISVQKKVEPKKQQTIEISSKKEKEEPALVKENTEIPLDEITFFMKKHFPEVRLASHPRTLYFDVLIIEDPQDPLFSAFSSALKSAIEMRLQKTVKIIKTRDLSQLPHCHLLLLSKEISPPSQFSAAVLHLHSSSHYKNTPEEKRLLWGEIQKALT